MTNFSRFIHLFPLIIICVGCSYEKKISKLFYNKTLLYSNLENGKIKGGVYEIREKRGDSIFFTKISRNKEDEWKAWIVDTIRHRYSKPKRFDFNYYTMKTKGKAIVITFSHRTGYWMTKKYLGPQYVIEHLGSSTSVDFRKYDRFQLQEGYSEFIKDTILRAAGAKFKCWVLKEYYHIHNYITPHGLLTGLYDMSYTIYLEKSSLIPIMEKRTYYEDKEFRKPTDNEYSILRSAIRSDSLRKYFDFKVNEYNY